MGADLGADAVLERRDDLAAGGVVLRVGGEDHHHVQRQAHREAFDLDVAFLEDVEQADLHLAGQVGQLVDGEEAAVGARQQAEVHRQLRAELQPRLGGLDRVDVADEVGDGHVGRGQLLDVAGLARPPFDRQVVAFGGDQRPAVRRERRQRVVVDLAARHHRDHLVEQVDQRAHQPRLRLAAQAEQDEVVPGEDGVDELRNHRLVVADHAREQPSPAAELGDQVVADFVLHRAPGDLAPGHRRLEGPERRGPIRLSHMAIMTP